MLVKFEILLWELHNILCCKIFTFFQNFGAGYRNRTDDRRLEICCFTPKLIPHGLGGKI